MDPVHDPVLHEEAEEEVCTVVGNFVSCLELSVCFAVVSIIIFLPCLKRSLMCALYHTVSLHFNRLLSIQFI